MIVAEKELKIEGGYAPDLNMKMGEVNRQYILIPPFDISTYSVRSEIVKPDNTFVYTDQAINTDGNILLTLPEQAGAVAGYGHYIIKIYDLNTIVYSAVGVLRIDDHLILDGMIESIAEVNGYRFPDDFVIRGELGNIFDDSTVSNETGWTSQKISQEIGSAAVVFDDTQISNSLGWTSSKINTELLGMFDNTTTSATKGWTSSKIDSEIAGVIDDTTTSATTGWSSSKIDTEIAGVLDDTTTSSTTGWSSDKISTEIAASDKPVSKTASGNPLTFADGASAPLVSCDVTVTPDQDLHGYSKPWAGGDGKNKFMIDLETTKTVNTDGTWSGNTYTVNGIDYTLLTDNADNVIGIEANGTSTGYADLKFDDTRHTFDYYNITIGDVYTLTGTGGGVTVLFNGQFANIEDVGGGVNFTASSSDTYYPSLRIRPSTVVNNVTVYPICRKSTESATFTPYSNICPITGKDSLTFNVAPTQADTPTTTTATFPSTVYGGEGDVMEGEFESEWVNIASYNGETISEPWLSSMDEYAPGATPTTGAQVVYKAATSTTVTYTTPAIRSISGQNTMWSDADTMGVEYITQTYEPIITALEH